VLIFTEHFCKNRKWLQSDGELNFVQFFFWITL